MYIQQNCNNCNNCNKENAKISENISLKGSDKNQASIISKNSNDNNFKINLSNSKSQKINNHELNLNNVESATNSKLQFKNSLNKNETRLNQARLFIDNEKSPQLSTNEILNELYKNLLRNKLNMNLNNNAQLNNNKFNLINSQNSNNTSNNSRSLIELSDYNK